MPTLSFLATLSAHSHPNYLMKISVHTFLSLDALCKNSEHVKKSNTHLVYNIRNFFEGLTQTKDSRVCMILPVYEFMSSNIHTFSVINLTLFSRKYRQMKNVIFLACDIVKQ